MSVDLPFRSLPRLLGTSCLVLLQGACGGTSSSGTDGVSPRADDPGAAQGDGVSIDGLRYPFTSAIGEIWGRRTAWPTHFNVDYLLSNGRFVVTPIVVDGESTSVREPVGASAVFRAELYAPDVDSFPFADYGFVAAPEEPEAIAGRRFFTAARLGVDRDRSGEVEESEMREVIDGTISFVGPVPDISLTFSLTLEDGATTSGSYAGLFEFIER